MKAKVLHEVTFNQKEIMADIQKSIDNFDNQDKPAYSPAQIKKKAAKPVGKQYLKKKDIVDSVALFQKKVMDPSARDQNLELSDLLRNLIAKGYFEHQYDFGLISDQIVADAYAQPVPAVQSPCPKPAV